MNIDSYIEHYLKVLADEFNMYLYRTNDGKWCVSSPAISMSSSHIRGTQDEIDFHKETIFYAVMARIDDINKKLENERTVNLNAVELIDQKIRLLELHE